jgi:hypothetical protein
MCLLQVLQVFGRERARERERSTTQPRRLALRASGSSSVSICTFVPVKQVNRVPASGGDVPDAAVQQNCSKAAVKQQ